MKILKVGFIVLTALSLAACGDRSAKETASSEQSSLVENQTKEMLTVGSSLEKDGKEVDGTSKKMEVEEGTTVLEVLKDQYEVVEEGGFIVSIDGMKQDEEAGKYWMYEVNDKQPTVGAAEYLVKDGDQVKWFLNALH